MKSFFLKEEIVIVSLLMATFGSGLFIGAKSSQGFDGEELLILVVIVVSLMVIGWAFIHRIVQSLRQTYNNLNRLIKETLHELNLPIATITANVEMVKNSLQEPKELKRLDRILQSTQILQELYQQLSYSIKEEILIQPEEEIELSTLVQERIDLMFDRVSHVTVKSLCSPLKVKAHPIGLKRIIDNLLSNSIKYNKIGGHVDVIVEDNQLIIQDTGEGISPENMLHIFDQYYQVDEKKGGFGLGLNIVKHYCDLYKIALFVDSIEGQGTKVTLFFKNF